MKVQAVLLAAARVSSLAATGGLAEITKTLPGGQIRAQFAGMKLTDEVHHASTMSATARWKLRNGREETQQMGRG
jgi:hypothetical protein